VNDYEMVYIVSPRLSSDEAERATAWVDGLIRQGGGELLSTDVWGRRRLAYPIKHQFEGTYVYSTFRLDAQSTRRIESELALSEDVLRHLMVRGIVEGGRPEPQSARVMAGGRPSAAARPQPQPEAEAGAAGSAEAQVEPEAAASAEAQVEPEAEPEAAASVEAEAEPEVAASAEAEADSVAAASAEAEAEPEAAASAEAEVEPEAAASAEAEPEAGATDSQAEAESEREPAGVE